MKLIDVSQNRYEWKLSVRQYFSGCCYMMTEVVLAILVITNCLGKGSSPGIRFRLRILDED